jgi:hypothetical protein
VVVEIVRWAIWKIAPLLTIAYFQSLSAIYLLEMLAGGSLLPSLIGDQAYGWETNEYPTPGSVWM